MWVKFDKQFRWDYEGTKNFRKFYPGAKENLPRHIAEAAIEAGAASATEGEKPSRKPKKPASEPENEPGGDSETVYLTDNPGTEDDGADTAA